MALPLCVNPTDSVFAASRIVGCMPALRFPVDTTNITSPADRFAIDARVMYRFITSQEMFTQLMQLNVDPAEPTKVNLVVAEYVPRGKSGNLMCSIVVGYDNARNVEGGGSGTPEGTFAPEQSNEMQNAQFEQNLKTLGIRYGKHAVIQIFNWYSPDSTIRNQMATPMLILLEAGFNLLSFKIDEASYRLPLSVSQCGPSGNLGVLSMFLEVPVSELQEAIDVLAAYRVAGTTQGSAATKKTAKTVPQSAKAGTTTTPKATSIKRVQLWRK